MDELLPPPNVDVLLNDPSCYGILGVTLAEALDELQQKQSSDKLTPAGGNNAPGSNESKESSDESTSNTEARKPLQLSPEISHDVLKSLGEALAKCHKGEVVTNAPAALLQGRVDHFNRRGTKWRIVVKNAQMRRRFPLDRHRRKRDKKSLWSLSKEKEDESATKFDIEMLAYDDFD
jgi:hypothetical protein